MKNKLNLIAVYPFNNVAEIEINYKSNVEPSLRTQVFDSIEVFNSIYDCYDQSKIEHKEFFYCMYLNRANQILGVIKMSEGGISGTVVDVKIILQAALLLNASCVILSHNHPSGSLKPSQEDIKLTKKVKEACEVMDISLLDHIIVTPFRKYYSFNDNSML